jgi:protease-4
MFSRRHPYLFFSLVFSAIIGGTLISLLVTVSLGFGRPEFGTGAKVGIIEIAGVITDARTVVHDIKRFREDDSVKAIVIRIDSPGGGVGPSQEIYREIRKTTPSKKVIASMGAVAASGGYYAAAGTHGIMANPGTITGSIGVIMGYTNFEAILKRIGLVPVVVKSGAYKDMGSPVREMTEDERQILQEFVRKIHTRFIHDIAEARHLEPAKVQALADGRIYTGEEAKDLGLIDRLGNLEDAVEWAGRLGGIQGKIAAVYAREKKFSLLEYLMGASLREMIGALLRPEMQSGYLYPAVCG